VLVELYNERLNSEVNEGSEKVAHFDFMTSSIMFVELLMGFLDSLNRSLSECECPLLRFIV